MSTILTLLLKNIVLSKYIMSIYDTRHPKTNDKLGHVDYGKHERRDYHGAIGGGCINVARRIEYLHAHVEFETAKWWQLQSDAVARKYGDIPIARSAYMAIHSHVMPA
jgi:hypothetical protein